MVLRKSGLAKLFLIFAVLIVSSPSYAGMQDGHNPGAGSDGASGMAAGKTPEFPLMPAPGEKVQLDGDHYLIYGFDRKPKMGTAIIKVNVYTKDGAKDTTLQIFADSGMPSMRGAHDTGDLAMQLSKNKDYLLPINIVMPGDWEIRITVKKAGKVIFRGSHRFDI